MRPSRRMIGLALALVALSVLSILLLEAQGAGVALPWLLFFGAGLLDAGLVRGRRNLILDTEIPEKGFVGRRIAVTMVLSTRRGPLPPRIDTRLTLSEGLEACPLPPIRPEGAREIRCDLPLRLSQRGRHRIERLSLRYRSPLGLLEILPHWRLDRDIAVLPDISPILNGEIQARMLPLMEGMKDMRLKGSGSEFHQLRDYVPGMDPREIDWKRSARMRTLVARETRAERNHQIVLAVDSGRLMGARLDGISKLDHAIHAALALTWASGFGGDSVGFANFDSLPRHFLPPRPGRAGFAAMQARCADLRLDSAETNHTLGLSDLAGRLNRRSLVVVFSDFVDSIAAELLVENLTVMTRQHLVLFIALRDPEMDRIARTHDLCMPAISRAVVAAQMQRDRREVLTRLDRQGVLCLDTPPGALTGGLISRYIEIKAQELI